MSLANFIFYLLLFIGFFLPTNSNMYIPLPGILLKVNELSFLLLPIVNLFCNSNEERSEIENKVFKYAILYLVFVVITEFLFKPFVYYQSISASFKAFRLGIPLYSSLLLLSFGVKANIRTVWQVLLIAVGISVLLSVLSIFVNLPIYYNLDEEDVLSLFHGRIINANASFGIVGIYLLLADDNKWYNQGKLVKYVSILSIIGLVLTFNRTYLAIIVLEFIYLAFKTFSLKSFYKIILYPFLVFGLIFSSYNSFDNIKYQIDKRILSIVYDKTDLVESTIDNNRDAIYEGVQQRLEEGYWFIGLPYSTPILKHYIQRKEARSLTKTDISFVNILLRFGFIPLIFFLGFLLNVYKHKYVPGIILFCYVLASLNIDALFNQNSVFFLIIFIIIHGTRDRTGVEFSSK
jgi:hypothetical protein